MPPSVHNPAMTRTPRPGASEGQRQLDERLHSETPLLMFPGINRILGDVVAAVLLSQIVYWTRPAKNGSSRIRVTHGGEQWIAKTAEEWAEECGMTRHQVQRAVKVLVEEGLITKATYPWAGALTVLHIRLNIPAFLAAIREFEESGHDEPDNSTPGRLPPPAVADPASRPNGCHEPNARLPYTETTSEITQRSSHSKTGVIPTIVDEREMDLCWMIKEYRDLRPDQQGRSDAALRKELTPFLEFLSREELLRAAVEATVATNAAISFALGKHKGRDPVAATIATAEALWGDGPP
jgi:hypothetical protein